MDEFAWIDVLRRALGSSAPPVPWGIGDDAALLPSTAQKQVIATDLMVEGIHFRRDWSHLRDVAYKLYASNASDMWAMGAKPTRFLLSVVWDDTPDAAQAHALAEGFLEAMTSWGPAELIGGDTSRGGTRMLSMTMLGVCVHTPWRRDGFQAGDQLWIDGPVGWSAAGLDLLQDKKRATSTAETQCVAQHLRPQRIAAACAEEIRGGIDISDGLAADLLHAARASGVRFVLDQPLPGRAELLSVAKKWHADTAAQERLCEAWQLGGGEDYVRVVGAPSCPGKGWTCIGRIETGPASLFDERGAERQELNAMGWNHFRPV